MIVAAIHFSIEKVAIEIKWPMVWIIAVAFIALAILWFALRKRR